MVKDADRGMESTETAAWLDRLDAERDNVRAAIAFAAADGDAETALIAHAGAGNHERAVGLLTESVELAREAGDPAHLGSALRTLGRRRRPTARRAGRRAADRRRAHGAGHGRLPAPAR